MSPSLALIIVLIFIGYVIYQEHKRAENLSSIVWITAIWILYSGSKGLGFYLNINTTIEAGSLPDRYFMLFLVMISILILFKKHFSFSTLLKNNIPVVLILTYSLISVLWSRDAGISFRRWGREAVAFIIALILYAEKNPIRSLTSGLKRAIYAALPLSLLLIKYFPAYGRSYGRWSGEVMWEGIASQKNGLAMICSLSILYLFWSLGQDLNNWSRLSSKLPVFIDVFMILLALYLMMGPRRTLSYSATSFLSLLVGLTLLIALKGVVKRGINIKNKIKIFAVIIIATGVFMPFLGEIPIKSLPALLNRNETLTGRTEIWRELIPYAKQNLLLGHGFGGFWTTSLRNRIASHAHNGYLDTILDIGIIGLLLFISFILCVLIKSLRSLEAENYPSYFFLTLIFVFIFRNISESPFGEFSNLPSWLLLTWSFILSDKKEIMNGKYERVFKS